jgi:hypothetical protein
VERATLPAGEPRTVQEDAGAVDSSGRGLAAGHLLQEPGRTLLLELPVLLGEANRVLDHLGHVLLVPEMRAVGAAPLVEVRGIGFENPFAALAEDALPRGTQKRRIDDPGPLLGRVFERDHFVKVFVALVHARHGHSSRGHQDRLRGARGNL